MAEQFKALISKFGEIWGQIGLNQRISIILAGGAVLAGVVTLGILTTKSPDLTLVSGISDAEAANITAALDDEKIPYELAGRENTITVPKSIYHKARMKLALKGIPETGDKGYKVFDEPSFGRSDYVQRLQHQVALQQELEMTIKEFDEVDAVRVHIVPPKRTLLVDPTTLPKASVWIKKAKIKISPSSIDAIQNLVAHAVEGLEPSNVTVVDEEGTLLSKAAGDDSIESNAEGQLKARKDHEQYLSDKVQGMLDRVLGSGKSIVKVNVSMTTDAVQQVSRMYNPTNQVILNSTTQEQYEVSSSPEGGVPGTTTNSPQSTNSFALPPGYTSMTNVIKDIQFGNEELTTTTTKMPGTMTNISASVIIDTQYQTDTNGIVVSVMRPQAEIDNLKVAVMNALAIQNSNTISLIQLPFENSDQTSMLTHIKKNGPADVLF
ncbi:MAG: flagellar M-ring protein FliF [Verrucomicrobia bacterium]|nr:flagellar M-ring protein FliF [Verrucomicrobiota bacterium]